MLNIGMIEYINALPFHLPFLLGELEIDATLTYDIPSKLNCKLREGKLDMALTSLAEYFDGPYERLPGYCIAAQKQILSVNLYIRGPLDKARIGLTHHSATSVELLKVLCHHFWKLEPTFEPLKPDETYDGFLLIGDDALKKLTLPGYQTIDLATEWYKATQLPFVFAVFLKKQGITFDADLFEAALQWSNSHQEQLVFAAKQQSGLPKSLINRYYDLCKYRMGEKELEGLQLFEQLRKRVSEVCA